MFGGSGSSLQGKTNANCLSYLNINFKDRHLYSLHEGGVTYMSMNSRAQTFSRTIVRKCFHQDCPLYDRAAWEQCKATHPVCVIRWPLGLPWLGLSFLPRLEPYRTAPALTPIHLDRPFLSGLPVWLWTQMHVSGPSSLLLIPPPCQLPSLSTKHMSKLSFSLHMRSHTSETACCENPCWRDAHGQHKEQSWVSRPQMRSARAKKLRLAEGD